MTLGFTEILLIVLAILILFGAKRIPELARSLGRASAEFKKAKNELTREGQELMEDAPTPQPPQNNPGLDENGHPKQNL